MATTSASTAAKAPSRRDVATALTKENLTYFKAGIDKISECTTKIQKQITRLNTAKSSTVATNFKNNYETGKVYVRGLTDLHTYLGKVKIQLGKLNTDCSEFYKKAQKL